MRNYRDDSYPYDETYDCKCGKKDCIECGLEQKSRCIHSQTKVLIEKQECSQKEKSRLNKTVMTGEERDRALRPYYKIISRCVDCGHVFDVEWTQDKANSKSVKAQTIPA